MNGGKEACPVRTLRTRRMEWSVLVARQNDLQQLFNELETALQLAQSDKMCLKVVVHVLDREDL